MAGLLLCLSYPSPGIQPTSKKLSQSSPPRLLAHRSIFYYPPGTFSPCEDHSSPTTFYTTKEINSTAHSNSGQQVENLSKRWCDRSRPPALPVSLPTLKGSDSMAPVVLHVSAHCPDAWERRQLGTLSGRKTMQFGTDFERAHHSRPAWNAKREQSGKGGKQI